MSGEQTSEPIKETEVLGFNRSISVTSFTSDDSKTDQYERAPESLLVKYNNQLFDVYGFLQEHPGGRMTLEKYANKDITQAFDGIGHSEYAKMKMKEYLVTNKDQDKIEKVSIKTNVVDRAFVYKKLFSKEDPQYIHKTFGFLSLLSYCYRYFIVYPTTGTLGFTGSRFDWATLIIHFFLTFSSLIFHVVEKRILSNPLIIYQEYRMHAILFTFRAVGITLFGILLNKGFFDSVLKARVCLATFLFLVHSAVDYVTKVHGTPGVTAVRHTNDGSIKYVKLFFAFYQVLALSTHLLVDEKLCDLGWNTLVAIQSSAFLMTLKRKSLIRTRTHFLWYTFALALSIMYIINVKGAPFVFLVFGVFCLKVRFDLNKYAMWSVFATLFYAAKDYGVLDRLQSEAKRAIERLEL